MKNDFLRRGLFVAIAVAVFVFVAGACGPRAEGLDPSKIPDNVRADYEVFAVKCSKCHGLSRPLQSGITDDEQWKMYVRRMRRQQGSGISPEDEKVVLRFLHWYSVDLRQKQAERRGEAPPPPSQSPPPAPPAPAPAPPPAMPSAATDGGAQ